ncbi:MAG: hypothetical protein JRI23_23230 [Deltaproteobacteria bacterium]|nr:hypothetical protein [Deltaproteobacteria bacterium]
MAGYRALVAAAAVGIALGCSPAAPPPPPLPAAASSTRVGPEAPPAAPDPRAGTDYLVLAPRAYLEPLGPLLRHREGQGHRVLGWAVEEIYARYSDGRPDARALYAALRELWAVTDGGLRFVLLVGDVWRPGEEEIDRLPTVYLPKLCYNTHDHEVLHHRHGKLLHTPHSHDHHEYPSDHPFAVLGKPGEAPAGPPAPAATGAPEREPSHPAHGPDHDHDQGYGAGSWSTGADARSWSSGQATSGSQGGGSQAGSAALPLLPARGRASVAIGRLPARDLTEITAFVDKLITYETAPVTTPWPRRLVVVAGPARYGRTIDAAIEATSLSVLEHDVPYDYDLSFVFAKPGSAYAYRFDRLGDKLVEEANRGALMLAYVGHSSPAYFDSVEYRGSSYLIGSRPDFLRMQIAAGFPLFVSLSCGAGGFDLSRGWRSTAEAALMNPHGAVASFAASRESHPYANMLYGEALVAQFLRSRPRTIGEGMIAVKRELRERSSVIGEALTEVDTGALKEEHASLYNLFGDPATRLRYPAAANLSLASTAAIVAGASFDVGVSSPVEQGVALVTLETERSHIRHQLVSPAALDKLPIDRAFETMEENHRKASDKVVMVSEVTVEKHRAVAQLRAPSEPGNYVVKAFVRSPGDGEVRFATGHLRFRVEPTSD